MKDEVKVTVEIKPEDIAKILRSVASAGASDLLAERFRQIAVEGWAPEHDDEHANGELAALAACYALASADPDMFSTFPPDFFPSDSDW